MTAEEFHSVAADTKLECAIIEVITLRRILFELHNQSTNILQRITHLEADIQNQKEYLRNRKVPFKTSNTQPNES